MNAPEHFEAPRQTDHLLEQRGNPSGSTTPAELCSNEQAPPRGPVRPGAPVRGTSETFIGGAGI
jgi:hypothetical protein